MIYLCKFVKSPTIFTIKVLKNPRKIYNENKTYPQCTVIDSFILKESSLCFKEGYPPNSEPPKSSVLVGFSSSIYVKFWTTGDTDGELGIIATACSTGT